MTSPTPNNEAVRLEALRRYQLLDTAPEQAFDDITCLASFICETPIALLVLVDRERQLFKSKMGLDTTETPRNVAFCAHTIMQPSLMVVPDACVDPRFANNPLVTSPPHIRFYAGVPLLTNEGLAPEALCVIDHTPRELTVRQREALAALARQVITQIELRRTSRTLAEVVSTLKTLHGILPICAHCKGIRDDKGSWRRLEEYVRAHTEVEFSHGICPNCVQKHYADIPMKQT